MTVEIQIASTSQSLPNQEQFIQWVGLATESARQGADVVIRIVDQVESAELNTTYRQKEGATNVLSFPFEMPNGMPDDALTEDILGDLVICAPIVEEQAEQQGKLGLSHWAHMVIHGCLHLQGYDHVESEQAMVMENLEIKLLDSIGIGNPYSDNSDET
ncbi:MAG: rRNA maturation RNase YbeY [Cycloclasticus sp.]|nr:rRNA maturation RNase YbeY [Cycloclasticus sp.]MBQ0789435.1 rRNA maturation RNase YbeY [Cycloclasticus sp.]